MKDLRLWLRGAIESILESKPLKGAAVTQEFICDVLEYTTVDAVWADLLEKDKSKLVGLELGRLQKRGRVSQVPVSKVISKEKFYSSTL